MYEDIINIAKAMNPMLVHKPHPRAFSPFGETPRGQLYNGALFQMLLYTTLLGGASYVFGRKGSLDPKKSEEGNKVVKALKASIKLPGTAVSGTDKVRAELIGEKLLTPAAKEGSAKIKDTTTFDRYLMGALPVGAGTLAMMLMHALGKRDRKLSDRGSVLIEYLKAQEKYDAVLRSKLFPEDEKTYMSPPDAESPDEEQPQLENGKGTELDSALKEGVKNASELTRSWRFTGNTDYNKLGKAKWLIGAGADAFGVTTILGATTMIGLLGSFVLGRHFADKASPRNVKLKTIRKALDLRQTHRYVPKLVLPESIDVDRAE